MTPRNPNGTPAIVSSVPDDAVKVHASFSIPIVLEAGRVVEPDARRTLHLDVYLRKTGVIARSTTMFVHFERREPAPEPQKDQHAFFNGDHQVLAGSFFLSDAPEGALVHDAFAAKLEKAAPGTYDVWIGFGSPRGRGERAKVGGHVGAEPPTVSQDRVRIGTFELR